ncbi:hypothetical protein BJF90_19390 [Pseudonocardia sp. CNS-004]|nr:hypothetical protein BJF90_19390 [Pseudonocardia sp. CNS-004]
MTRPRCSSVRSVTREPSGSGYRSLCPVPTRTSSIGSIRAAARSSSSMLPSSAETASASASIGRSR